MTAYGQPALHELRRVVQELNGGDPMTPVTIRMPNNLAGVVARRFLTHGLATHRRPTWSGPNPPPDDLP